MGSRIASHNQPKWSVELQPGCRRDRLPPRVAWIIWTERADRPELVDSSSYFISGPHGARKSGRSRAMLAEAVREELIERNVASIVRPHDPRSILIIAIWSDVMVAKTAAGIPLATKTWTVSSYSAHWLEHVAVGEAGDHHHPRLPASTRPRRAEAGRVEPFDCSAAGEATADN